MATLELPAAAGAIRQFTVEDVLRMVEVGIIGGDERVELIDGVLVQMSPEGLGHVEVVRAATGLLSRHYPWPRYEVQVQSTTPLEESQYRMPDVLVARSVSGRWLEPPDLLLMVEVAQTSLAYDLGRKVRDYAAWGAPTYWVVDIDGRRVEVFEEPRPEGYRRRRTVDATQKLGLPGLAATLPVAELLRLSDPAS